MPSFLIKGVRVQSQVFGTLAFLYAEMLSAPVTMNKNCQTVATMVRYFPSLPFEMTVFSTKSNSTTSTNYQYVTYLHEYGFPSIAPFTYESLLDLPNLEAGYSHKDIWTFSNGNSYYVVPRGPTSTSGGVYLYESKPVTGSSTWSPPIRFFIPASRNREEFSTIGMYSPQLSTTGVYYLALANQYAGDYFYADSSVRSQPQFSTFVNDTEKAFYQNLPNDAPTSGGDPYEDLPVPGDDPIPGGDNIPEPGFPSLSAASTGIVGLFCPSVAQMQQLADFMWTDFGGQGTTVIEVLEEVVEAIKRAISNPLDYIFGLNMIPSQGLNIGASKVVKFGFVSSGVSMPILADHYFRVDCGSLSFDTLCGDSFLDYAPYSKFSIYLPYIGFKDLDPNDLVGHTISVVYHGDAITGGLTAYIFKDGNIMYQYSGGCALNIPLSSDNWGATIAAAASVATGVLSAAAVPGAAGVAGAGKALLAGAASNVASNPSLLSPQVMHSGAVTGSPGFMGVQYPFIIREAVNFHSTAGFNKSSGYPAYYYKKLGDVSGYTTVMDAHMANIPMATQEEIEEIENLLESGVIL